VDDDRSYLSMHANVPDMGNMPMVQEVGNPILEIGVRRRPESRRPGNSSCGAHFSHLHVNYNAGRNRAHRLNMAWADDGRRNLQIPGLEDPRAK